jgi:LCP family protein required for cell wall assembly
LPDPARPLVPPVLARWDGRLRHRWFLRAVAATNVVLLAVAVAPFLVWSSLGPERFDDLDLDDLSREAIVSGAAPTATLAPTVRVTLLYSVGSRGMTAEEAARLRVDDLGDRGGDGLTDTMMVLVADTATRKAALLSIPRDLWMFHRGHRINASLNRAGIQGLVDDVSGVTGLPVHHVVQVNFGAFADLVDAVGGVAIAVDRPLADLYSVLYVPEPGCWRFTGADALGYARSRHTLTLRDGRWRADATASDFGRMARQRELLGAVWDQVRGPSLLTRLPELIDVARRGLVVDAGLGVQDVRDLASAFADVSAGLVESLQLPTVGRRINGAAAQVLDEAAAAPLLARLQAWPPDDPTPTPTDTPSPAALGRVRAASAAPVVLAQPAPCHLGIAQPLPDPRAPLGGIAAKLGGGARAPEDDEDDAPAPTETPTETGTEPAPTETPTETGTETAPTEPPTEEPTEEPTDEPRPFPTIPLPGRRP